ncbi:MAG: hypothetical protein Kow0059_16540 [Candidatus Sumerlaeia bacterium]
MTASRHTAFSIVELLVAIIILGILVAIIVPRLASRTELARLRKAQADLEMIQNAQERASIDTGYLYRLYALDDNPDGDGIGYGAINDVNDGIKDEHLNTVIANPVQMFIYPSGSNVGQLVDPGRAAALYVTLSNNETGFNWNGPYVTYQADKTNLNANNFPDNIPDDPWGNNYLFFTREGLVQEFDDNTGAPVGQIVVTYQATNGASYDTRVFDRATILSMGPNGLPGDGSTSGPDARFGRGDDLFRSF